MARQRLDAELVRRGLARSRDQARELIETGCVRVNGAVASKPATQVELSAAVVVDDQVKPQQYVSRGAHKLIGALDAFPQVEVIGRQCLDAGASTGGFTQVLLERGASTVIAVDVGYGQLAWSLQSNDRVTVLDRTNVRALSVDDLPYRPSLVVADLSFISLGLVVAALASVIEPGGDLLLMVKPQFEVGRENVGDGVVRDLGLRAQAVRGVAAAAHDAGLAVRGVTASPLPGPQGNVEYFLWLTAPTGTMGETDQGATGLAGEELQQAITRAVEEGPQ